MKHNLFFNPSEPLNETHPEHARAALEFLLCCNARVPVAIVLSSPPGSMYRRSSLLRSLDSLISKIQFPLTYFIESEMSELWRRAPHRKLITDLYEHKELYLIAAATPMGLEEMKLPDWFRIVSVT